MRVSFVPLALCTCNRAFSMCKQITGIDSKKTEQKIALYADDIVLYTNLDKSQTSVLKIFQDFSRLSGLKVNFTKSKIYLIYLPQEMQANLEQSFLSNGQKQSGDTLASSSLEI